MNTLKKDQRRMAENHARIIESHLNNPVPDNFNYDNLDDYQDGELLKAAECLTRMVRQREQTRDMHEVAKEMDAYRNGGYIRKSINEVGYSIPIYEEPKPVDWPLTQFDWDMMRGYSSADALYSATALTLREITRHNKLQGSYQQYPWSAQDVKLSKQLNTNRERQKAYTARAWKRRRAEQTSEGSDVLEIDASNFPQAAVAEDASW